MTSFVLDIIIKLFKCNIPNQFIVDKGIQKELYLSWKIIFDKIRSKHWHKTDICICSSHTESLYEHLIKCAEICYEKAFNNGITGIPLIKICLAGLLHDIGKISTQKEGVSKNGFKFVSFKGHGIVGGASIVRYWDESITTVFGLTEQDWGDISTCADYHMCTYFPQQTTIIHKFFTGIFPDNIKILLQYLRFGDILSAVPSKDNNKTIEQIHQEVIDGTEEYENTLWKNSIKFKDIGKNGILIMLNGSSGSGKSTFAKYLFEYFGKDICIWINRDLYMINWSLTKQGINNISSIQEITPILYQKCYTVYKDAGKYASMQINKNILLDISTSLSDGKIVILDTIASMYNSIYSIIPEIAINSVRFAFWLTRNKIFTNEETSKRYGIPLETQLNIHGDTNLYNFFPKNIEWYKNISILEDINDDSYKPYIAISLTWNNCKTHIINHFISEIKKMQSTLVENRIPTLEETNNMTLLELIKKLWDYDELSAIKLFFNTHQYNVSTPYPNVVGIKYRDGINRIWRPLWARQARGIFFYLGEEITVLKYGLQRGIEVLTAAHLEIGINKTQDIDEKTLDILDDNQQYTMKACSKIGDIDAILSAKVDGCLVIINVYHQNSKEYKIIYDLVMTHGDEFIKKLINYCHYNKLPIWIPSSNGTLIMFEDMQIYFLTAIQSLLNKDIQITKIEDWENIIPHITTLILDYWIDTINLLDIKPTLISFFFEAICKNRISLDGKINTLLACSYEESNILLFGASYEDHYVPHNFLPYKTFKQPLYINIESTEKLFTLMKQLDNVVLGKISINDFLLNFEIGEFTSKLLHPEGFVLLSKFGHKYDYAKVKTELYYQCHKIKENNIKKLLEMPQNCSTYYPILKNLHNFYDNIYDKINMLISSSFEKLKNEVTLDSVFYTKQNIKAQHKFNEIIKSKNPTDMEILYKMMLNNRSNFSDLEILFNPITNELYNIISIDMINFVKNILMKIKPWLFDWELRITKMIESHDDNIIKMYELVVGFSI